jgi:hypothetical protein
MVLVTSLKPLAASRPQQGLVNLQAQINWKKKGKELDFS